MPKSTGERPEGNDGGVEFVPVNDLLFDAKNPRLVEYLENKPPGQEALLEVLWQNMAVDELVMSIAASGYFPHEPLLVADEEGRLVVIEGNRRLAAVKLLLDEGLRKKLRATDIPSISKKQARKLETLPVIRTTREDAWQYLGFKHVNGPARWDAYAKAQYIASVRNEFHIRLDDIARQIGDKHNTVQRLYRALMVIDQAEREKVFDRANRHKEHFSFSHLYTGLGYEGIAKFLHLRSETAESRSPVPKARLKELGELCTWLYGDKTQDIPPKVISQNPYLRQLDEVLCSKKATDALRAGLPLNVALDVSYGDDRLFRNALIRAKDELQKARGTLSTGYQGEDDLLRLAEDIRVLVGDLVSEMERVKESRRRQSKRP